MKVQILSDFQLHRRDCQVSEMETDRKLGDGGERISAGGEIFGLSILQASFACGIIT